MTEEKTYTKSEIMQALSFIKTPDEKEILHCRESGISEDSGFAETGVFDIAMVGAEVLVQVLFDGLDPEKARSLFKGEFVKAELRSMAKQVLEKL